MLIDSPEYKTKEFFPSADLNFIEVDSDECRKQYDEILQCFPEKKQDVFKRALSIGESAIANLQKYAQSDSGKQLSVCYL